MKLEGRREFREVNRHAAWHGPVLGESGATCGDFGGQHLVEDVEHHGPAALGASAHSSPVCVVRVSSQPAASGLISRVTRSSSGESSVRAQ